MVHLRSVVRDGVFLCAAVAVGWWFRGAGMTVLAQHSGSSSSARGASDGGANLAFQMIGSGPGAALALYNPGNHTLYVYNRVGEGNSEVSCSFSYSVANPGAAIRRENCAVGELLPGH